MNSNTLSAIALALIATTELAWADDGASFTDRAEVISSTPVYQQVNEPRRECWTETVGGYSNGDGQPRGYGGAIVGGLVGGLLGNTVGQGNGRVAAAAIGAVTGAVVGDRVSSNNGYNQPRQVERCNNHDNYRQVVSGYNVVYRYQGRTMTAVLPQDPGRYVNVNVNVGLIGSQRDQQYPYPQRQSYYDGEDD